MTQARKTMLVIVMPLIILMTLTLSGVVSCKKEPQPPPPAATTAPAKSTLPTATVDLADQTFTLELAYKRPTRAQGLMFRPQLAPDAGMIFIFDHPALRSFYMKNCLINLDALFLDPTGRILKITTMKVPQPRRPLRYYHCPGPIKYVIELPAHTAANLKLKPGQKINLPPAIRNIIPDPD